MIFAASRGETGALDTSHFQGTPQGENDGYSFVIDGLGVKGVPEPYYGG